MRPPAILCTIPLPNAFAVAAWGNYCFVACKKDGVVGIDITNPQAPVPRGVLNDEGMDARHLVADHDRLFVAGFNGGLYIYNIRDPLRPYLTARLCSDAIPLVSNLCVWGNYVLLAGADSINGRFVVVDVSNMAHPRAIGLFTHVASERANYESVAYDGRLVYVGTNKGELHILNASNPGHIHRIGEYYSQGTMIAQPTLWGIAATPGRVYLADWGMGMLAIDTTNPTNPRELGVFKDNTHGANTHAVVLDGQTAYVANGWGGVQSVDISNPTMMRANWDVEPHNASYLDVCLARIGNGLFVLAANNGTPQSLDIIRAL